MTQYIYEPKGKAREYGELALNLYRGCSHGCRYCYVPAATFTDRTAFLTPSPRKITQSALARELALLADRQPPATVFLCFTCDPYQYLDEELTITRETIKLLHAHNVGVNILTKGGHRSARDFDLLAVRPDISSYGATLTFLSGADSSHWEPAATLPWVRMKYLARAHELGIPTWASLEPVIDPLQSLELIRRTAPFVDTFKVGRWNHDERANAIDWAAFARTVVDLLESLGKRYYIKADLAKYLAEPPHRQQKNKNIVDLL